MMIDNKKMAAIFCVWLFVCGGTFGAMLMHGSWLVGIAFLFSVVTSACSWWGYMPRDADTSERLDEISHDLDYIKYVAMKAEQELKDKKDHDKK